MGLALARTRVLACEASPHPGGVAVTRQRDPRGRGKVRCPLPAISLPALSTTFWSKLFDDAPVGMAMVSHDLRILRANRALGRFLGYRPHELHGMTVRRLTHPDDWAGTLHVIQHLRARPAGSGRMEKRCRHKSGQTVWGQVTAWRLPGQPIRQMVVIVDLTERRRAEAALREREAAQAALINASTEGIMLLDPRGVVRCVNDALASRLGLRPADYIGQSAFDHIQPPAVARSRRARFRTVLRTRQPLRFEDGRGGRIMDNHIYPALDPAGRVTGVAVFTRDVTEQKQAERALRESEAKYRRLHESLSDAYGQVDLQGRLLEVNQAYCDMLGYTREEMLRLSYRDLTPSRWHALEERVVRRQVLKRGYSDVYEKEYRRRDGTILPVELRAFLLRDAAGRPQSMWAIVRDISERKRADQALSRARAELEDRVRDRTARLRELAVQLNDAEERERRRIVGILHGDVQQTLAGVRFMLDSARRRPLAEAARRRILRTADQHLLKAYEAMRSLCSDLFPPVLQEASLAETLAWLREDMRTRFGLQVEVRAEAGGEPVTEALRTLVFQAVRELLFNAAKHAGVPRARVHLRLRAGDVLEVEVQDRGRGFNSTRPHATGIGLFSLRERLHHMGGSLRIRSSPGRGTTVILTVPRR